MENLGDGQERHPAEFVDIFENCLVAWTPFSAERTLRKLIFFSEGAL